MFPLDCIVIRRKQMGLTSSAHVNFIFHDRRRLPVLLLNLFISIIIALSLIYHQFKLKYGKEFDFFSKKKVTCCRINLILLLELRKPLYSFYTLHLQSSVLQSGILSRRLRNGHYPSPGSLLKDHFGSLPLFRDLQLHLSLLFSVCVRGFGSLILLLQCCCLSKLQITQWNSSKEKSANNSFR